MKNTILIISILFFFLSCSDDSEDSVEQVTACFELSTNILEVGEEFQITNCSVGAVSYQYNFGNGIISNEESPAMSYEESGNYTIVLNITSASGQTRGVAKNITVNSVENSFLYPPLISESSSSNPINFGYANNAFYYIEAYKNDVWNDTSTKYNYVEVDLNNNGFSKNYLGEKEYNTGHAFLNILSNNDKLIYTVRSLSDRIELKEIKLNTNWDLLSTINDTRRVLYGSLEDNNSYLYYGAYRTSNSADPDFSLYKSPSIEIRNDLGELIERKTFNNEIEQGFIGDLIETNNGFMAFGGVTNPTSFSTFNNYRPLVILLDSNYEYISHTTYENTTISATTYNDLNGSFHISKLSNNNFVIYSHNEFRIINQSGVEILKENLPEQVRIQGLISLENEGFVLSRKNYLDKYDVNGNLIKSIRINGAFTPNLILNENKIYFASGYNTSYTNDYGTISVIRSLIGAVNTDLSVVNLN